jgi:hypothetical protein
MKIMKHYLTIIYLIIAIPIYGVVIIHSAERDYLPNAIFLVFILFIIQIYTLYRKQ